jgi:hypothetical protein
MAVVAASLYPLLPRWLLWPLASLAMLPTLALFGREWRLATNETAAATATAASPTQTQPG